MIKFKTSHIDDIDIPYGERLGGSNNDGPTCTQNGFPGVGNGRVLPEWKFNSFYKPQNGAKLFEVINGEENLVAIYRNGRFISVNK